MRCMYYHDWSTIHVRKHLLTAILIKAIVETIWLWSLWACCILDYCWWHLKTASQMQVAPRIVVQSCPLLTIYPRCCPRHATDMPQMMLQTCPKHGWVGWDGNLCKHLFCGANNRNRRRYHRFRLKQWFKDLESKHFFYSAGLFMPLLNIYWNAKKQGKFFVVVLQGITDKAVWLCSCILSKFKDPVPLKTGALV